MSSTPDFKSIPGIPVDADGPVFKAPWQAQAFALALRLQEQGLFTWKEWAEQLSKAIAAAQARGDPDLGDTYYQHWLAALEALVVAKGLATADLLSARKQTIEQEHQHEDHP